MSHLLEAQILITEKGQGENSTYGSVVVILRESILGPSLQRVSSWILLRTF
jgi:hypothetical protein